MNCVAACGRNWWSNALRVGTGTWTRKGPADYPIHNHIIYITLLLYLSVVIINGGETERDSWEIGKRYLQTPAHFMPNISAASCWSYHPEVEKNFILKRVIIRIIEIFFERFSLSLWPAGMMTFYNMTRHVRHGFLLWQRTSHRHEPPPSDR